jgi:hypothetical protein
MMIKEPMHVLFDVAALVSGSWHKRSNLLV